MEAKKYWANLGEALRKDELKPSDDLWAQLEQELKPKKSIPLYRQNWVAVAAVLVCGALVFNSIADSRPQVEFLLPRFNTQGISFEQGSIDEFKFRNPRGVELSNFSSPNDAQNLNKYAGNVILEDQNLGHQLSQVTDAQEHLMTQEAYSEHAYALLEEVEHEMDYQKTSISDSPSDESSDYDLRTPLLEVSPYALLSDVEHELDKSQFPSKLKSVLNAGYEEVKLALANRKQKRQEEDE